MNRSLLIAGAIAAAAVAWVAVGTWMRGAPPAEVPHRMAAPGETGRAGMLVQVGEPPSARIVREVTARGHTEPERTVELLAETGGRIEALPVAQGAAVAAGDLVARIAVYDREARLARARATLVQRQAEYDAARRLGARGIQPELQVHQARAALAAAQAEVETIALELAHTRIEAPFAGVLDRRRVELGAVVAPGTAVGVLVDLDTLKVAVQVPQQRIAGVRPGGPATVRLLTGEEAEGSVAYVSSVADPATRTFRVEIGIDNRRARLPAGLSAEVRIPVGAVTAHAVSPALFALGRDGTLGVKVLDADDMVRFAPVEIVRAEPEGVWVTGLGEGVRVITGGHGFVNEGERVDAVPDPRMARAVAPAAR